MSFESLQAIVGTALLDRQFRHDLLNSKRRQAISKFELTPEEYKVLVDIQADTLEQFAGQLDDWITSGSKESRPVRFARVRRPAYHVVPV